MKSEPCAMVVALRTPHPYYCQGDCGEQAMWRVRVNVNYPSIDLCTVCLDEMHAQITDTLRQVRQET
jgi:hypothetical protein